MRKRDIAVQAVTIVLAFAVGILVGGRACSSEAETVTTTQTVYRDGPERVVYECPPDAGVAETEPPKKTTRPGDAIVKKGDKALPDAPPAITPRERQRLLAWVRDRSADLDGCRSSSKETYRLAVTLQLDDDGKVRRVQFNAPPSELPTNVRGCLTDRMSRWEPPAELVRDRRELVFGLTL